MSEVQLDTEEQDIYETIRAGITEGGTTFEQARWVIDSLTDAGYTITKLQPEPQRVDVGEAIEKHPDFKKKLAANLISETKALREHCDYLEDELVKVAQEAEGLQQRIDMAENYIETQGKENTQLRARIAELQSAIKDHLAQSALTGSELYNENIALRAKVAELEKQRPERVMLKDAWGLVDLSSNEGMHEYILKFPHGLIITEDK